MYDVTDVDFTLTFLTRCSHECIIAEMTCDFVFCTRKLSLSRTIRFDMMVKSSLARLRLTFTETYRRY